MAAQKINMEEVLYVLMENWMEKSRQGVGTCTEITAYRG